MMGARKQGICLIDDLLLISVQETKLAKSGNGAIAWLPDTEV